jgi:hypothetical protein
LPSRTAAACTARIAARIVRSLISASTLARYGLVRAGVAAAVGAGAGVGVGVGAGTIATGAAPVTRARSAPTHANVASVVAEIDQRAAMNARYSAASASSAAPATRRSSAVRPSSSLVSRRPVAAMARMSRRSTGLPVVPTGAPRTTNAPLGASAARALASKLSTT